MTSNIPYILRAYNDWILDNLCTPYLLVNTADDAVCVPTEHAKNGQIVLNISPVASDSLLIDDEGVSFKARFSGVAREIYVPMGSILAIYARENGRGMAFSRGTCIEMNPAPTVNPVDSSQAVKSPPKKAADKPTLQSTKSTNSTKPAHPGIDSASKSEASKKPKGKPSLTIVK